MRTSSLESQGSSPAGLARSCGLWQGNSRTTARWERGGATVVITGDVTTFEDLTIDGQVTGTIELLDYALTIGEKAGSITARETVDIRDTGSLVGNVIAPRIVLADGGYFHGTVNERPLGH